MSKFSRSWMDDREFARAQILAEYQFDGDVLEGVRYIKEVSA